MVERRDAADTPASPHASRRPYRPQDRREFLATSTLGALVAALGLTHATNQREGTPEDGCFELVRDTGDIAEYRLGENQHVTILFTDHDEPVDVRRIPADAQHIAFDTGGVDLYTNLGTKWGPAAPPHYRPLDDYTADGKHWIHLLPPASPLVSETGELGARIADHSANIVLAGVGGVLVSDAVHDASDRARRAAGEIVTVVHRSFVTGRKSPPRNPTGSEQARTDTFVPLPKAVVGMLLAEPAIVQLLRTSDVHGTGGTRFTEAWLQNVLQRNPHVLPLMNQWIDVALAAKLRLLSAQEAREGRSPHFAVLMGGSHVRLGPWLTAPLDDVIGFMAHPLMQRLTDQLTPQGAESVAMSRAYLRKRTDPNNRLKEESTWRDFVFPDLVKTLGTEHREHLVGSRGMLRGMAGNPMCTVVTRSGKPMDLSSLLAGKL